MQESKQARGLVPGLKYPLVLPGDQMCLGNRSGFRIWAHNLCTLYNQHCWEIIQRFSLAYVPDTAQRAVQTGHMFFLRQYELIICTLHHNTVDTNATLLRA